MRLSRALIILIGFVSIMGRGGAVGMPRLIIDNNKNIFALFVLANITGYDTENLNHFSKAREIARQSAPNVCNKCANIIDEFKDISKNDPHYSHMMDILLSDKTKYAKQNEQLKKILSRFEGCASLSQLRKRLNDEYDAEIDFYRRNANKLLEFTLNTLNVRRIDYPKKVVIIPNPLDAHYRGYNVNNDKEIYIIVGAGRDSNTLKTTVHELIHRYVDPIVFTSRYDCTNLKSNYHAIDGYPNFKIYLAENIVRGLTEYVMAKYENKELPVNESKKSRFAYISLF